MITSNLKKLMEDKKVSLSDMVRHTGLAEMTIIRARREQITQCRLCTLETIARYLGCRTKDLYSED